MSAKNPNAQATPQSVLLEKLQELISAYGNANYDCGEAPSDRNYGQVQDRANKAREELVAFVLPYLLK